MSSFCQYWKDPGSVARANLVKSLPLDRFLAILSVIVQAAFSFQGMELVSVEPIIFPHVY